MADGFPVLKFGAVGVESQLCGTCHVLSVLSQFMGTSCNPGGACILYLPKKGSHEGAVV
jgi:hypothetical protein